MFPACPDFIFIPEITQLMFRCGARGSARRIPGVSSPEPQTLPWPSPAVPGLGMRISAAVRVREHKGQRGAQRASPPRHHLSPPGPRRSEALLKSAFDFRLALVLLLSPACGMFLPDKVWPLTSFPQETFYNGKLFKNTTAMGQAEPLGLGPWAGEQALHGPEVFIETRRADLVCI